MTAERRPGVLAHTARVYLELGRALLRVLLLLSAIAAAAAVTVVPLWLLATRKPQAFTLVGLSLSGCGIGAALFFRTRRAIRSAGSPGLFIRRTLLPTIARALALCALVVWAYWAVVFYAAGVAAAAVPLTVGWLAALGVTAAVFRSRKRNNSR